MRPDELSTDERDLVNKLVNVLNLKHFKERKKMDTAELNKFPHMKLNTQSNGSCEIYFTSLHTFEVVFDLMSFHRVKHHGHIKFKSDNSGNITFNDKAPDAFKMFRNENDEAADKKCRDRSIEILIEKTYSFCRNYHNLFVEANQLARNAETARLKSLLNKALTENKNDAFDRVEQRLFDMRYEPPETAIVSISNEELGF